MSVFFSEKKSSLNDNHFYRANPYSHQGYIPSVSLKNRKQPEFMTEIPQGIEHFQPTSRKHFRDIQRRSQIADLHLLNNPQRFPLENTLANDIGYDRNLNTIDINGASANSRKSLGVRNRIKAQEELLRRKATIITPLLATGTSQEEIRRKLAEKQLQRLHSREKHELQRRHHHSEKKLSPPEYYMRSPYVQKKDKEVQADMTALQKELKVSFKQKEEAPLTFSNPDIVRYEGNQVENKHQNAERNEHINKLLQNKLNRDRQEMSSNDSRVQRNEPSRGSSGFNKEVDQYFERERKKIENELMSRQRIRQMNPTYLSYEGSHIRNSNVFSNVGKSLTLK